MKKIYILFILFLVFIAISTKVNAQNTTNKSTVNNQDSISKKLVKKSNDGKIVLRMPLTGITDNTTIKGPTANMFIYNTATVGEGQNKIYPGYYQNIGTTEKPNWKRITATVSNAVKTNQ
jgi:uncharacterized protein YjiK